MGRNGYILVTTEVAQELSNQRHKLEIKAHGRDLPPIWEIRVYLPSLK
jgi:hypothetical protein